VVVVGNHGVAVVGYRGIASADDHGTASAGHGGTASAGYRGTASAGKKSCLRLLWWDDNNYRYREETAYVGENSIEPNVKYQLDDQHKFVEKL
jgi:hypothetical protein